MTEITLVRHGETEWNVAEMFRGRIDIELNETGVKQAELLAQYLSECKIEAIYSNPLKRVLKTAEIVADSHQLTAEIAFGLIGFDYGEWQGLPHQEVKDKYEKLHTEWINNPGQVRILAGESLNDVRLRAVAMVSNVITKYEDTVILVFHRVVNKVLICVLLGLDNSHFWNIGQDTARISAFIFEHGRFILSEHNNISFLKSIRKAPFGDFQRL